MVKMLIINALGVLFVFGSLSNAFGADAEPPRSMTYQGYLTDSDGVPLGSSAPANYDVQFRLYDIKEGGTTDNILWAEQQTVTVDSGSFSILLGEGSAIGSEPNGSLSSLFQSDTASDRYIGITVLNVAGSDVTIEPRLRLVSSPYSFLAHHALTANRILGINPENQEVDLLKTDGLNVGIGLSDGVSPGVTLDVNGAGRFRQGLTSDGDVILKQKLAVGKATIPSAALDVSGDVLIDGVINGTSNLTIEGGMVDIRPSSGPALQLHPSTGLDNYGLKFNLGSSTAQILVDSASRDLRLGANNQWSLRLSTDGQVVAAKDVFINGDELRLGLSDGKSTGSKTAQRALYHGSNDTLVLNFNGDFEGGTINEGALEVRGNLTVEGQLNTSKLALEGVTVVDMDAVNKRIRINPDGGYDDVYINSNFITTYNDLSHPVLALDSTGGGDVWANQGAEFRIGEGARTNGLAQFALTYRGDGWGVIGGGQTSSGATSGAHIQFYYQSGQTLNIKNTSGIRHFASNGEYLDFGRSNFNYDGRGDAFYIKGTGLKNGSGTRYAQWNGDSGWHFASDQRLKKDITDDREVLDLLMGVKVRQFRWKDDGQDSPKERGLIAQELEPFFPELVSTFEAEDKQATKSVNYTSLGIIALKGVQELKEEKDLEIDRLGKIIAEKQAKIDTLEERLDRLEQLLLNP